MSLIRINQASKVYGDSDTKTVALEGVDVEIEKGEFIAVMGPSGSGKSTLMNIIGLLDRPTEGAYLLHGDDVAEFKDRELANIRSAKIGFIFQNFNLLQRHTALENVALPMLYAGRKSVARMHKAATLLEKVGLEDRLHHMPNELSGGQMQRVAIARALANKPSIILADEPTGNLDSTSGQQIMELLKTLNEDGNTIIMVTHDTETAAYARRTIHLKDGRVEEPEIEEIAAEETEDGQDSTQKKSSAKKTGKKKTTKKTKKTSTKKTKSASKKKGQKK